MEEAIGQNGDDERAAFHRMLMQSAPSQPTLPPVRTAGKAVFDLKAHTAYTHGLEAIYALENVDPASIRRLDAVQQVSEPKRDLGRPCKRAEQLSLPLGPGFQEWMRPLFLFAPLLVLGLSPQAEKLLMESGCKQVSDLLDFDFRKLSFRQGYVDEIRSKLDDYQGGRDLERCDALDAQAFVHAMLSFCDLRAAYVYLTDFGLESICELSVSATAEIRRANEDKLRRWREEAVEAFGSLSAKRFLRSAMQEALLAFIVPWMYRRQGIASAAEIVERLQRIATTECLVEPFLRWIASLCGDLTTFFQTPTKQMCCADMWIEQEAREVLACALTYFYRKGASYPIDQLVSLVGRELAPSWKNPGEAFIRKVLSYSGLFSIRAQASGIQVIKQL